jgi:hypothetical protein
MDNLLQNTTGKFNCADVELTTSTAFNYIGAISSGIKHIVDRAAEFISANITYDTNHAKNVEMYRKDIETFLLTVGGNDSCWFLIRLTKKTNAFATPRWHRDGRMFPSTEKNVKYAITLLGAPTLAIKENSTVVKIMNECKNGAEEMRARLALNLEKADRIDIKRGQLIAFTCGEPDSLIHSEPDIVEDRIFMSLVNGTETQLRKLATLRNKTYENTL